MIPRIVIAGTQSGCGKTTVASGIMAALTSRGLIKLDRILSIHHITRAFVVDPAGILIHV